MEPENIPVEITRLVYIDRTNPGRSQNTIAETLAHYWDAIEKEIREKIAADLDFVRKSDISRSDWDDCLLYVANRVRKGGY
jgi:hypothetical protein